MAEPYIKSIAITSEPNDGDHYTAGEEILVELAFNRAVSIEPELGITIEVGDKKKHAGYHSGSSTDTLVFRYEVDDDDVDHDGISVPQQNGFKGSGHVWETDTSFGINELIPRLRHQTEHRVNGVLTTVVASEFVSHPVSGDVYGFGETIEIAPEFDVEVDVWASRRSAYCWVPASKVPFTTGDPARTPWYSRTRCRMATKTATASRSWRTR